MDKAPVVETEAGFAAHRANRRGWQATATADASKLASALSKADVERVGPPLEDVEVVEAARAKHEQDKVDGRVAAGKDFTPPEDAYANVDAEVEAQASLARDLVAQIADSGALGDGELTVDIKGFANPGNAAIAGHTADHITISVGQITPVSADVLAEIEREGRAGGGE